VTVQFQLGEKDCWVHHVKLSSLSVIFLPVYYTNAQNLEGMWQRLGREKSTTKAAMALLQEVCVKVICAFLLPMMVLSPLKSIPYASGFELCN
jgi:hypothetical protein